MRAEAIDTPVVGWRGKRVNTLRLWNALALDPIRLDTFNAGDHLRALEGEARAERLVRVLYPADSTPAGQELRLRQEYFFASASIQDIVRRHVQYFKDIRTLPQKAAIHLNDTHPAVAVAELMRLLIDDHKLGFAEAWEMTRAHLRLYQPHAVARGAGKLAAAAVRTAAAPPHADRSMPSMPICCAPRAGVKAWTTAPSPRFR